MPERKRKLKILMLHMLLVTTLLFAFCFFTLGPRSWTGVDEAVVEKVASEHGHDAKRPLIDPGEGDLLLFAFLMAGAAGGFTAGYFWRKLVAEKPSDAGRYNKE
jgi:ABC-type cobalt transport system substrate-binding protein